MVRFGTPGQNVNPLAYADGRLAGVPAIEAPRRPTITDKAYPIWCEWRVNKNATLPAVEGEFWKLVRFESNGDATWIMYSSGGGPVVNLRTDDDLLVIPDGFGVIDIDGQVVANGANSSPLFTIGSVANTADLQLQVSTAITGAPGDKNDAGICSFDDTAFSVDADGYVTLTGGPGPAVDSIDVDFNTGPGTDPVVPNASGQISIFGNAVTNGTNLNSPVASHSRAANQFHIDVQLSTEITGAPADPFDSGICSFDDNEFTVDGNGFVQLVSPFGPNIGVRNLGISYVGGTGVFTVQGSDGNTLSSTNPGYVTLPSNTPGELVTIQITSDQSFIDDVGVSDIIGNLFSTVTTVAWTSAMPFFIYAVLNDAESAIAFMISRVPAMKNAPAVGKIGKSGSAVADTQSSFFCIDSSFTVGDFDTNPCMMIGSFTMTKSTADDWTVQTLTDDDGIGSFQEARDFTFPSGVNGNATGAYIFDNGGTAPIFTAQGVDYRISAHSAECRLFLRLDGDGGTDGAGAVNTRLGLPLIGIFGTLNNQGVGPVMFSSVTIPLRDGTLIALGTGSAEAGDVGIMYGATTLINSDFGNGARTLSFQMVYAINDIVT